MAVMTLKEIVDVVASVFHRK